MKAEKYRSLLKELRPKYKEVKFVNLSISCLSIFGNLCDSFIALCDEIKLDYKHCNYVIKKLSPIIIRTSYYIFCMRNKIGQTLNCSASKDTTNSYDFIYMLKLLQTSRANSNYLQSEVTAVCKRI